MGGEGVPQEESRVFPRFRHADLADYIEADPATGRIDPDEMLHRFPLPLDLDTGVQEVE